jgi:hypothetical protein
MLTTNIVHLGDSAKMNMIAIKKRISKLEEMSTDTPNATDSDRYVIS